jgi:hypothetical protein
MSKNLKDHNLYVAFPPEVWKSMKEAGHLESSYHFKGEDLFTKWLGEQYSKINIDLHAPIYCHLTLKDARDWWARHARVVILTVRISDLDTILLFDDHAYIQAINGPLNDCNPRGMIAWSEKEFNDSMNSPPDVASCERMFDFQNKNIDRQWSFRPLIRGFLPGLSRDMVKRVKAYKFGKRVKLSTRRN